MIVTKRADELTIGDYVLLPSRRVVGTCDARIVTAHEPCRHADAQADCGHLVIASRFKKDLNGPVRYDMMLPQEPVKVKVLEAFEREAILRALGVWTEPEPDAKEEKTDNTHAIDNLVRILESDAQTFSFRVIGVGDEFGRHVTTGLLKINRMQLTALLGMYWLQNTDAESER